MLAQRWLEPEGFGVCVKEPRAAEDSADVSADLRDMFADPDPLEVVTYTFPLGLTGGEEPVIRICIEQIKTVNRLVIGKTGLTMWEGARSMCAFLCQRRMWLREHPHVLELGSGLGLCGMLCHRLGVRRVTMTDGDTDVLEALRRNVARNEPTESKAEERRQFCQQLRWGAAFCGRDIVAGEPTLIIGSDILYAAAAVRPVFETVSALLAATPRARFVLSFTARFISIDVILEAASAHGFGALDDPDVGADIYIFARK